MIREPENQRTRYQQHLLIKLSDYLVLLFLSSTLMMHCLFGQKVSILWCESRKSALLRRSSLSSTEKISVKMIHSNPTFGSDKREIPHKVRTLLSRHDVIITVPFVLYPTLVGRNAPDHSQISWRKREMPSKMVRKKSHSSDKTSIVMAKRRGKICGIQRSSSGL